MILVVIASMYIPRIAAKPQHNFVYAVGEDSAYIRYSVDNGVITQTDNRYQYDNSSYAYPPAKYPDPRLYLYDVVQNSSSSISFSDAQKLKLDSNTISPDGFEVVRGGSDGFGFFFGGSSDYNSQYLKGHGYSKKLNLALDASNYYYSFRVVGWVK
jgi:hypothetical protein